MTRRRKLLVGVVVAAVLGGMIAVSAAAIVIMQMGRSIRRQAAQQLTFSPDPAHTFTARWAERSDKSLVLEIIDTRTGAVVVRSTTSANPFMTFWMEAHDGRVWMSHDGGLYVFTFDASTGLWAEAPGTEWALTQARQH